MLQVSQNNDYYDAGEACSVLFLPQHELANAGPALCKTDYSDEETNCYIVTKANRNINSINRVGRQR